MPDNRQQPSNANRLDRIERALEHLLAVQASHETRLDRLEGHIEGLAGGIESLVSLIRTLAEQADRRFAEIDRRFAELAEAQQHADERLNALIQVVDQIVRGRGAEPPQQTG